MLNKSYRPQHRFYLIASLMITLFIVTISFFFVLSPSTSLASTVHTTTPTLAGPTFHVSIGFNARYKDGTWVPVRITLNNNSTDFNGTLSINPPPSSAGTSSSPYQVPITLPAGAQKQLTIYIPLNTGSQGSIQNITAHLLDSSGNIVQTQTTSIHALGAADIFVGILSDQHTGFVPLSALALPNPGALLVTEFLDANNFPTASAALNNLDLIILDDFTTSTLSTGQLAALQTWINQGGSLIEVGGPEWERTLNPLPSILLPVALNGINTLPPGTRLLPIGGPSRGGIELKQSHSTEQVPIVVSTASTTPGPANEMSETILASGTIPLIVQRQQGQGTICYLAFDPTLNPILSWPGTSSLWKGLLLRTVGDQLLAPNSGAPILPSSGTQGMSTKPSTPSIGASIEVLLQSMLPQTVPLPWMLLILLLSYLLMLGPIRFLIVKRLKQRDWSWRIFLCTILIFSFLVYGIVFQEKGTSLISNSISIMQLNQDDSSAHITTYVGVFVPDQGNFQVHIPDQALAQPLTDEGFPGGLEDQAASITVAENGTSVNLLDVPIWTMRTIVLEQERPVNRGIASHLTLDHGLLTGSITNTTNYALSDVYLLINKGFIHLGHLAAGQTRYLSSTFKIVRGNAARTLADQIAWDNGLPIPYLLDAATQYSMTPLQQHMTLLSTLSGEIGSYACGSGLCPVKNVPMSNQKTIADPVLFPTNGDDPLLVPQAPATLIGWADQAPDIANDITVNGSVPQGTHEVFVQAPLAVTLPNSSIIPPSTITGKLIDVEGNNVQTQPGIYLMTTGSMTFELTLPGTVNPQSHPLNISLLPYPPDGVYQIADAGARTIADGRFLQIHLYNWHTHSWDATALNMYALLIQDNAHIGPDGRILFQLANQNPSRGTFVVGQPILNP